MGPGSQGKHLRSMAQPRLLLFPFPAPGHIKPFLRLAELLSDAGLDVVFLNTEHNHRHMADLEVLTARFPTLHFETISDGLPPDRPRNVMDPELYLSLVHGTKPQLRQLIQSFNDGSCAKSRPITCIIADVVISAPFEVAEEMGIPVISFCTYAARYLLIYFWTQKLFDEDQIPYTDDNPMGELYGLPLCEGLLRRKDLPGYWNAKFISDEYHPIFSVNQTVAARRSSGLIVNTFDELEAPFLTHLSSIFNKIYAIGPLNALSKSWLKDDPSSSALGGFWKEDKTCMSWLDSHPSKSAIFVSFGSTVKMKVEELIEFWHGLANSGKPFLCVLRPEVVDAGDGRQLIKQLVEEGGKAVNGIIVEWAPQEKILNHPAVGGFLTHCGWNSTMESIAAGVPMICWPVFGDQSSNATWIDGVWKIGLEMKDKWDRSTLEKIVRALVEDGNAENEIRRSVEKFSTFANESVRRDGGSFHNMEILMEDVKKLGTE